MSALKINDGGAAFPSESACASWQCRKPSSGMSLRDWFAGQAVAGLLAQPADPEYGLRYFARSAYLMADEMLKAREEIK